jgi:hypothetical protein
MKRFLIIPLMIALMLPISRTLLANHDKYTEVMQKNIQLVYTAKTIDELQSAVNALERISNVEKEKWEPLYYSAFGYVMMSTRTEDNAVKDSYLDQALALVGKAKTIAPEESEIAALEGFVYMMQVSVDPGSRGPKLMGVAVQQYERALKLNPENPRAMALLAQMQFGAAQFFKSPTTEACATNDAALIKFESFKSENPLAPVWGKQMAEGLKANCGK